MRNREIKFSKEKFKARLDASGISYKEFARRIVVDPNTVSRWLSYTKSYTPRGETLGKIMQELRCTKEDLFEGNQQDRATFTSEVDSQLSCEFNAYGIVKVLMDGRLIYETNNDNILTIDKTSFRTIILPGRIGRFIAEAAAKGLVKLQDEKEMSNDKK